MSSAAAWKAARSVRCSPTTNRPRRTLYAHLAQFGAGAPVYLEVPEYNSSALELTQQYRMVEVFGCARMYLGPVPDIMHDRVFGVTTFELG